MTLYNSQINLMGAEVVDVKVDKSGKIIGLMLYKNTAYIEVDIK